MVRQALQTRSGSRRSPEQRERDAGAVLLLSTPPAVETDIRILKDGLIRATCTARAIGPRRVFVQVDPLFFPVNSHLEIEFLAGGERGTRRYRLPATVIYRSISGVELKLESN